VDPIPALKYQDNALKQASTTSLQIMSNTLFEFVLALDVMQSLYL
jgi:hypothetical protein